jgi:hypothetical protein
LSAANAGWKLSEDLEDMVKNGTAIAILSGRFGYFASIPMTDTDGTLKEAEYALDTSKADDIGRYSNYRAKWLGDASFDPSTRRSTGAKRSSMCMPSKEPVA